MKKMKRFKWKFEIELDVAEVWVADGFDPLNGEWDLMDVIRDGILEYATPDEKVVRLVKVKGKPSSKAVAKAQGYEVP